MEQINWRFLIDCIILFGSILSLTWFFYHRDQDLAAIWNFKIRLIDNRIEIRLENWHQGTKALERILNRTIIYPEGEPAETICLGSLPRNITRDAETTVVSLEVHDPEDQLILWQIAKRDLMLRYRLTKPLICPIKKE